MEKQRNYSLFHFFFNDTATTEIYTLSLHDALPISDRGLSSAWTLRIGASNAEVSRFRSEEHTSELQSRVDLVCRLLLEKKKWVVVDVKATTPLKTPVTLAAVRAEPRLMDMALIKLSFFFNDPATTEIYTLSLHDALPIFEQHQDAPEPARDERETAYELLQDRKSTRLNSSHEWISYAVFCLKKKKIN